MRAEQLNLEFPHKDRFMIVDGWLFYHESDHYLVRINLETERHEIIKIYNVPSEFSSLVQFKQVFIMFCRNKNWSLREVNNSIGLIFPNQKTKKRLLRILNLESFKGRCEAVTAYTEQETEMGEWKELTSAADYLSNSLDTSGYGGVYCYNNETSFEVEKNAVFTIDNRLYWLTQHTHQFFLNSLDMEDEKARTKEELKSESVQEIGFNVSALFGDKIYFIEVGNSSPRILLLDLASKSLRNITESITGLDKITDIKYARQDESSVYIFTAKDDKLEISRIKVLNSIEAERPDQFVSCFTCAQGELRIPMTKAFRCAECVEKSGFSDDHYLCGFCTAANHRGHNYKTMLLDDSEKLSFLAQFNVGDVASVKRKADQISSAVDELKEKAMALQSTERRFEEKKRRIMEAEMLTVEELEKEKEELEALYKTFIREKYSLAELNAKIGK